MANAEVLCVTIYSVFRPPTPAVRANSRIRDRLVQVKPGPDEFLTWFGWCRRSVRTKDSTAAGGDGRAKPGVEAREIAEDVDSLVAEDGVVAERIFRACTGHPWEAYLV